MLCGFVNFHSKLFLNLFSVAMETAKMAVSCKTYTKALHCWFFLSLSLQALAGVLIDLILENYSGLTISNNDT